MGQGFDLLKGEVEGIEAGLGELFDGFRGVFCSFEGLESLFRGSAPLFFRGGILGFCRHHKEKILKH